jgi:acetylornithine deacetylase/succinyl-diaminopimelate desuccinylase-like protein
MDLDAVLRRIDEGLPASLERLKQFVRIPSISTDPAYREACDRAADWLVARLAELGIEADKRPTPGHPMVVGHGDAPGRHLLFYGHYDVQPVDPVELWDRDPFDPAVEETGAGPVVRGRGASDDKGQLLTFVEACRAWRDVTGRLPAQLTFLFEGEEESGSPSLVPFLEAHREELSAAGLALICDTTMYDRDTPTITTTLRGLVAEEVTVTGPARDLHSGNFGGIARNPIRVLTRLLAGLHDDDGRVTVPGFYDGVEDVPHEIAEQWRALGFDARSFLGDVGLAEPAGEVDRDPLHQIWSRPTCDVNGIRGGYAGEGFKTVVPSQAHAKISFRIVGRQDPYRIRQAFRRMMRDGLPSDCTIDFIDHGAARASAMDISDPAFDAARRALDEEWPRPAVFAGGGGTIPVAGYFKEVLGLDSLLIGFARHDNRVHSPNEKYDVESFHKGMRSWARVLARIAHDRTQDGADTSDA